MTIVKLQLDCPQEFLDKLDAEVKVRSALTKPMSKLEWMHKDKHGKAHVSRVVYKASGKTSAEINKEIDDEYRKCVGPAAVGRPKLAPQRLAIIIEAVTKYLEHSASVTPMGKPAKQTRWG